MEQWNMNITITTILQYVQECCCKGADIIIVGVAIRKVQRLLLC